MKSFYLPVIALLFTIASAAQNQALDTRKYIEVTGSADMSIAPDEIGLEIQVQEYDRSGKKIKLDDINDDFYRILRKNHIDTSSVTFEESSAYYWWHWWWYYRSSYYQTRTITLKLNSKTNILKLVEDLNEKWVQNIRIAKSTHSRIQEYRRQVKTEAAKMAKEKALYLLDGLGEKLGGVLSVEEVPDNTASPYNYYWLQNQGNLLSNSTVSQSRSQQSSSVGGVSDIKMRYEVKVKFAIQ